ncbi:hypothetical protein C8A00DRAFT_37318 [Chaetomidium leptoderma]|uniref:G domain-containing protein n=1 Tax=Chaetomidium leptoderma TaxID=669021 RepID=A0AAN6VEZ2_9PEZI|nr:hypothetical protein C8A00DRAFT_37318 [Chaetomidium leptoderma]
MSLGTWSRPALGQTAQLGALYDARSDTFIRRSLFKDAIPEGSVNMKHLNSTTVSNGDARTFKDKCNQLGIDAELGASILANLVPAEGCAQYLAADRADIVGHTFLRYTVTTVEQELNLAAKGIRESLAFSTLDNDTATHVVVGVRWGGKYIICPESTSGPRVRDNIQEDMDSVMHQLGCLLQTSDEDEDETDKTMSAPEKQQQESASHKLLIFGDALPDGPSTYITATASGAESFARGIRPLVSSTGDVKGTPIMYTLMPLSLLAFFRLLDVNVDLTVHQSNPECLEKLMQHLDDNQAARTVLERYVSRCRRYPRVVPLDHVRSINTQIRVSEAVDMGLEQELADTLKAVRSGKAKPDGVGHLLRSFQGRGPSPARLSSMASLTGKIDFAKEIILEGSEYVGFGSCGLDTLLARNRHDDTYVLYFNDQMRQESGLWKDTFMLLLELLRDDNKEKMVVVIDCDAIGQSLEKPYISQLRHRRLFIEDLLEHRKVLAANCVMRYQAGNLDTSLTSKPLQRRAVRIPCPHSSCAGTLCCNWICHLCQSPVEYGYVDDRIYCDCGATPFDRWHFKCNDPAHGTGWVGYDREALLARLKALEPFEELNILILGETGVGKSTWINAFVNYLTYGSLDDAIQTGDLKCLIPCSFSTQLKDPSDPQGRFVQKDIKIGKSQHEHDGARGQSATQCTSVYTVDVGKTRVRLIDTPGIGDTKGLAQDNQNMADILRVLRTYDKLHGIMILLKPNAARLTVMFRFCVKQLLTQLHKNAANNIVFGFTNTRGSNYKPGDTFKPLEALLTEYKQVKMGLFEHNVYCFDSESFRYLAAQQKGIDMGFLEDNTRSWEYSVSESKRLLKHIQGLTPHQVRSTINLNETRDMIVKLTEPMTLIAQSIQTSIAINNDQIKQLRNTELSRTELEKSLYVQRETVESYDVGEPRTVCTHSDCVEVRNDFAGRDETVVIYKTMCHKPCFLGAQVKRNQKGDPQLRGCHAMDGDGFCRACGHNYMDHMHIYYDYRSLTYRHENQTVSQELIKNASDIDLQQKAIELKKTAIEEFKLEHTQVQEAAIQFGFFLKRHAIEPYNDATVEYVEYLIHQEKMKIKSGGKKETLAMLQKYRAEHLEKVQALTKAMERGDADSVLDDQGVRQLVDSLYGLPHFGEDLKRIVRTNEKAAEATFREKSCNVSAGRHWDRDGRARTRRSESVRGQPDQPARTRRTSTAAHAAAAQAAHTGHMMTMMPPNGQTGISVAVRGYQPQPPVPSGFFWFPGARRRLRDFWPFSG